MENGRAIVKRLDANESKLRGRNNSASRNIQWSRKAQGDRACSSMLTPLIEYRRLELDQLTRRREAENHINPH